MRDSLNLVILVTFVALPAFVIVVATLSAA
jgi:hypothetical protein